MESSCTTNWETQDTFTVVVWRHDHQRWTEQDSVFTTNQASVTDNNGPLPELQLNNSVEVPENSFQVNDSTMEEISQAINPFTEDGNHGINLFVTLVNFLENKQ